MKKWITVIAIVALAAAFAGCGGAKQSADSFYDAGAATIKVGTILPISGPVAAYGTQCRDAILLAFEQINAKGGVLGKKLELVAEDDEANPEKTVTAYKKLTSQDKVKIIIGGLTSKCTLAITKLAQEDKVILISPTSTNDKVTDAGDYIFRACYKDSFQGAVVAKFAVETLKAKKAAVIFDISNDYSIGLKDNFVKTIEALGGTVVATESYNTGDKDFKAQLTKIKAAGAEVILVPDYYSTVALVAKQARDLGIKAPMMGGDGWDEITNNAGDEVIGCFYSNHYSTDSQDPLVTGFIAEFQAKYSVVPNALAALGYDTAVIVADAIAASKENSIVSVRDAMMKTDKKFVTGQIKFDADRNTVKSAVMLEIVKGDDGKLTTKYAGTVNP